MQKAQDEIVWRTDGWGEPLPEVPAKLTRKPIQALESPWRQLLELWISEVRRCKWLQHPYVITDVMSFPLRLGTVSMTPARAHLAHDLLIELGCEVYEDECYWHPSWGAAPWDRSDDPAP